MIFKIVIILFSMLNRFAYHLLKNIIKSFNILFSKLYLHYYQIQLPVMIVYAVISYIDLSPLRTFIPVPQQSL